MILALLVLCLVFVKTTDDVCEDGDASCGAPDGKGECSVFDWESCDLNENGWAQIEKDDWDVDALHSMFPEYEKHEQGSFSKAFGAKFRNFMNMDLDMYWDDGGKGVYNGRLKRRGHSAINTYGGHTFIFYKRGTKKEIIRYLMDSTKTTYIIHPKRNSLKNEEYYAYLATVKTEEDYFKEHGIHWQAPVNRPLPLLNRWKPEHLGKTRAILSNKTHFNCVPESEDLEEMSRCRDGGLTEIDIVTISEKPQVFWIRNFLSSFETEHIISLGYPNIHRSLAGTDGGFESTSRTSKTSWVAQKRSLVMKQIYHRAADVLRLKPKYLREGSNAESMQYVHYKEGEFYNAHHDFGMDGRNNSRYITMLLYLNDRPVETGVDGGETGFPHARGGKGMKAYPDKGDAILFYNILEDGNYDDRSLHEARKPKGNWEKHLCNFWIWDPHR